MANKEEAGLPKATVGKIIREILPSNIKCSAETRDLFVLCCIEFVHLITSEADDICNGESKKTMGGDHILKALQKLGFQDYANAVMHVMGEHKEHMQEKTRWTKRTDLLGKTPEQLREEQQALFRQAKELSRENSARLQKKPRASDLESPAQSVAQSLAFPPIQMQMQMQMQTPVPMPAMQSSTTSGTGFELQSSHFGFAVPHPSTTQLFSPIDPSAQLLASPHTSGKGLAQPAAQKRKADSDDEDYDA